MPVRFTLLRPLPMVLALAACDPSRNDTDGENTGSAEVAGCFEVDGGGAHNTLQEAVDAAQPGGTIAVCDARFTEAVVIGKDLTIAGAGATETDWRAPTNDTALTIEGAAVTVTGMTITSTRSGISVSDGVLTADDLTFDRVGNYAIDASNSDVAATGLSVAGASWGGIKLAGGALDLAGADISDSNAFGVFLSEGATGTIADASFSNITFEGDGSDLEDGWGIRLDAASATVQNVTFTGNVLGDMLGVTSEFTVDGGSSSGAFVSVWLDAGNASISNFTITDYLQYGIVQDGGQTLTLTNTSITTLPELSAPQAATDDLSGSYGIVAFGSDVSMTGGTISGANGGGLYHANGGSPTVDLTMSGATFDNNARFGLVTFGGTMTLTDVTVKNTRDDDATCYDESGYIVCNMAVAAWQSNLDWTGGTLSNNGTFGLMPILGSANVENVLFQDNQGSSAHIYESAFTCDGCEFHTPREYGVYLQDSSSVITDSTFHGGTYVASSTYDETDGTTTTYDAYYAAQDVWAFESTLKIEDCTFTDGDNGVSAYSSDVEIADSTFTGYNADTLTSSSDSTVLVTGTNFTNIGSNPASCYGGSLELSDVTIQDVNSYTYRYDSFSNGTLEYSSTGTSVGSGLYASDCDLVLEDVNLRDIDGRPIYASNADIEMNDVKIHGAMTGSGYNDAAVLATYSTRAVAVTLNAVEITGITQGAAVRVTGSSSTTGNRVTATDVSIGLPEGALEGVGGSALNLTNIANLELAGLDIASTGDTAIVLTSVTGTIAGVSESNDGVITESAKHGIQATTSTLTVTDLRIEEPSGAGILGTNAALTAEDIAVRGATVDATLADAAVKLTYTDRAADVTLTRLSVSGAPTGAGVRIAGSSAHAGASEVSVTDLTVGLTDGTYAGTASDGFVASDLGSLVIAGFDTASTGGDAFDFTSVTATLTGVSATRTGTITGAGGHGINASGSTLTIDEVTMTDPDGSGLLLGTSTVDIEATSVSGAARYGIECSTGVTFPVCDDNSFAGELGENLDCPCVPTPPVTE